MNFSRRQFVKTTALSAVGFVLTPGLGCSKSSSALTATDYTYFSIAELSELVRQKKLSPFEITQACLKRIEQLNPKLNAFITVTAEEALKEAMIAETEIRKGKWKGPLHGIPIALKDNIDTEGILTTAASGVYKNRIPTEDAELVIKLKKAGAIIIGKNNLHEFALGTTSHISFFGAVRNPWNSDYISGGSSGGSAAAVAAGMCYASIGTDTGGSIRLPAACCGLTGFKPTYGLISIQGIIPVIQSIDHAGPICRTVEDAALLMNVLASPPSEQDNCKLDYHTSFNKIKSPRIGIVKNFNASNEVREIFRAVISTFQSLGCKTSEIELPTIPASVVADAEIEAYHRPLLNQFKDLYDPITFNDINSPKTISSMDYINDMNKMETDRNTISKKLFKNIDVLILPTTASLTPTIEEAKAQGPFALSDENTWPFNHLGLPAISIPCGFDKNEMPVGFEIVGPRLGEPKVLDIAHRFQKNTNWHLQHPTI